MRPATEPPPSTYWVDADNRVTRVNATWVAFARENEAADLEYRAVGRPLESFIAGTHLAQLLRDVFAAVRTRGRAVELSYRCDSPRIRRAFDLRLSPETRGVVECASRLRESREREVAIPLVSVPTGFTPATALFLTVCSWCKRARLDAEWEELEALAASHGLLEVDPFPPISHGLCGACADSLMRAAR